MTKEEKQLLFKDLCARLPYGRIKCQIDYGKIKLGEYCPEGYERFTDDEIICAYPETYEFGMCVDDGLCNVEQIKPYLRPMSSMTEEEKEEFRSLSDNIQVEYGKGYGYFFLHCVRLGILPDNPHECIDDFLNMEAIDWLNEHHFDYRGLIPMGLALEAPKDMYKQ